MPSFRVFSTIELTPFTLYSPEHKEISSRFGYLKDLCPCRFVGDPQNLQVAAFFVSQGTSTRKSPKKVWWHFMSIFSVGIFAAVSGLRILFTVIHYSCPLVRNEVIRTEVMFHLVFDIVILMIEMAWVTVGCITVTAYLEVVWVTVTICRLRGTDAYVA